MARINDEVISGGDPGTEARTDLDRAIELLRMAANTTAEESADGSLVLTLAEAERLRYELGPDLAELNRAIASYAQVLTLQDESQHDLALLRLGRLLRARFAYGRRALQLDASIALLRDAADIIEEGELAAQCLVDLTLSLTARFDATARRGDLDEAIDTARQSADMSNAVGAQGRLAELLIRRYHLTSSNADLDEAMQVAETALQNTTPDCSDREELEVTVSTARGLRQETEMPTPVRGYVRSANRGLGCHVHLRVVPRPGACWRPGHQTGPGSDTGIRH